MILRLHNHVYEDWYFGLSSANMGAWCLNDQSQASTWGDYFVLKQGSYVDIKISFDSEMEEAWGEIYLEEIQSGFLELSYKFKIYGGLLKSEKYLQVSWQNVYQR